MLLLCSDYPLLVLYVYSEYPCEYSLRTPSTFFGGAQVRPARRRARSSLIRRRHHPQVPQSTPEHSGYHQRTIEYHRIPQITQSTPEYPRVPQGTREYPGVPREASHLRPHLPTTCPHLPRTGPRGAGLRFVAQRRRAAASQHTKMRPLHRAVYNDATNGNGSGRNVDRLTAADVARDAGADARALAGCCVGSPCPIRTCVCAYTYI